jgi:SAM-dependent methyltransferase
VQPDLIHCLDPTGGGFFAGWRDESGGYASRVTLHPLVQRFAEVADAYERGRPEYPPAVAGALAAELGLRPDAVVLDLAAGTGKLSKALLAAGLDVVAVEPLASLREMLADKIGAERVRDGVAEAIPLGDRSVDAVTVADAFHWFDKRRALAEIGRVLRPGGGLAVLATVPDWGGASWAHELGTLVMRSRPEHPYFDGPGWQEAVHAAGAFTPPREVRVTISQPARPEQIADHVGSMSWIAAMPDGERIATLEAIRTMIREGQTPAELPVHFVIGMTALA